MIQRILKWFVTSLAVIGAGVVIGFVTIVTVLFFYISSPTDLPERFVLNLDLRQFLSRSSLPFSTGSLGVFSSSQEMPPIYQIVRLLDRAARDNRVAGLVLQLGGVQMSLAEAQEIREAIRDIRSKNKPVLAFADTYVSETGDQFSKPYYLANAADEIWIQPSGEVDLLGLSVEFPFLRDALNDLGIKAEFVRRGKYKTAMDMVTESQMTAPDRESWQAIIVSWLSQLIAGVSEGRSLDSETIRALIDQGPYNSDAALKAKLVDRLGYWDEARNHILDLAGPSPDQTENKLLPAEEYLAAIGSDPRRIGGRLAFIIADGTVERGADNKSHNPMYNIIAETYAQALRQAVEDPEIDAILLQVNSPGGSYVASDTIWREMKRARKSGKPVVALMGDVAASGGYFIAMSAERLFAQPASLTGSIGVYGGKLSASALWEKYDIHWDKVAIGAQTGMYSSNHAFTTEERRRLDAQMEWIYQDFVTKAAEARSIAPAAIEAVARGRVWTGADAQRRDLIDELGGLRAVLFYLRERLEIKHDERIELQFFPEQDSPINQIMDLLNLDMSDILVSAQYIAEALESIVQFSVLFAQLGTTESEPYLRTTVPAFSY